MSVGDQAETFAAGAGYADRINTALTEFGEFAVDAAEEAQQTDGAGAEVLAYTVRVLRFLADTLEATIPESHPPRTRGRP